MHVLGSKQLWYQLLGFFHHIHHTEASTINKHIDKYTTSDPGKEKITNLCGLAQFANVHGTKVKSSITRKIMDYTTFLPLAIPREYQHQAFVLDAWFMIISCMISPINKRTNGYHEPCTENKRLKFHLEQDFIYHPIKPSSGLNIHRLVYRPWHTLFSLLWFPWPTCPCPPTYGGFI